MQQSGIPHRESHLALLPEAAPDGLRAVAAVIVPTARGAHHLRHAAELAAALGAVLVALCSGRTRSGEVGVVTAGIADLSWFAVDVPDDHAHPLLPPVRAWPGAGGRVSLSRKRNLGLLIARMRGWDTVLFLDDDIRGVSADLVRLVAGGLNTASAVALAVEDFPDNSVVCHANRLGDGGQTVFVGGAALIVDVEAPDLGHFPTVYNEDWLYLFDALAARRVRRDGTVRQLPYDPFAHPARAQDEEFGDIVAEGLVAYLEQGGRDVPLGAGYWRGFLRRRQAFLRDVTARVARLDAADPRRPSALRALGAAAARCATIRAADVLAFLRAWRADLDVWRAGLATLTPAADVPEALARLGLTRVARPESGLAVIVPGFLDGQANPAHHALAGALGELGLTTLVFEPGGLPGRPGAAFTHTPSDHLADLAALVDAHAVPGAPVVLIGHCYGAWLAGLHAARDPRITALVALMPTRFFLWPHDYHADRDSWGRRGELLVSYPEPGGTTLNAVRLPHRLVADALGYDLPAALRGLDRPVLLVAGTADEVIDVSCVERLRYECGSPDAELHVLDVQHDYRDVPAQTAEVTECVRGWLEKRLY